MLVKKRKEGMIRWFEICRQQNARPTESDSLSFPMINGKITLLPMRLASFYDQLLPLCLSAMLSSRKENITQSIF